MAEEPSVTVIRPYIGAGPVEFGMTLDEVEAVLGPPFVRHDDWGPGFVCGYGRPSRFRITFGEVGSRVEEIEILDESAVVEGVRLTGSYSAVRDALANLGAVAQIELLGRTPSGSRFFPELGVDLWSEDPDDDRICTVGVMRRDEFHRRAEALRDWTLVDEVKKK